MQLRPPWLATSILDQNANEVQTVTEADEKRTDMLPQVHGRQTQMGSIRVHELMYEMARKGKLNLGDVVTYFPEQCWFGKRFEKEVAGKKSVQDWVVLLAPSLHHYFLLMRYACGNASLAYDLVQPVDSLTLKLEGLLRDLCLLSGGSTLYVKKDVRGRTITMEKPLDQLLRDETLCQTLGDDNTLFLKYLLIEKAGMNLRHKVAHCLMRREDYTLDKAHLLFLALLRLSGYEVTSPAGER